MSSPKIIKVRINVTAADIDAGRQQSCTECPIAIALARAVSRRKPTSLTMGVRVATIILHSNAPGTRWVWPVPERISQRIRHFDWYGEMYPFKAVAMFRLCSFETDDPIKT